MAFLFEDQDEDEQNPDGQQPQQVPGTGQPQAGQGQAAAPGSGQSTQRQFVDVNAYLDANKDQAGTLADRVSGKINEAGQSLRNDIGAAETQFGQKVDEGSSRFDEGLYSRAIDDPNAFIQNQGDLDAFTRMRTNVYGGPRELADVAPDLRGRIEADTARYKSDVDTSSGRKEFLRSIAPGSTAGMLSLDELLLGGDQGARAKLTSAANQFGEIGSYLDEVQGRARTKASEADAATAAARNTTAERLGTDISGYQQTLNERLAQAYAQANQRADAAKASLATLKDVKPGSSPNLSPEILADLDISPEDLAAMTADIRQLKHAGDWYPPQAGDPLGMPKFRSPEQIKAHWMAGQPEFYNVDFDAGNYGTKRLAEASFGLNELAGEEDYAKAAALARLSGQEDLGFLNAADRGKAGTADLDIYDFNAAGAKGAADQQLSDKDRLMAASLMGRTGQMLSDDEIRNYFAPQKGFHDNIATGRLAYHSANPEANARGLAMLRALNRLGIYDMPANNVIGEAL